MYDNKLVSQAIIYISLQVLENRCTEKRSNTTSNRPCNGRQCHVTLKSCVTVNLCIVLLGFSWRDLLAKVLYFFPAEPRENRIPSDIWNILLYSACKNQIASPWRFESVKVFDESVDTMSDFPHFWKNSEYARRYELSSKSLWSAGSSCCPRLKI